ncbi:glycoside hydrolase family 88 protein [Bacteroides intestinalis]|jgi:unsaturated chondroitin disaccharide hydrolase|uniref:Glucuronyl hydrolase n=1 Tax=Bacteroides intestinalis TaxID=329854 RepID=A0AB37M8R3_9BACE|nr:glycoside hydrolase family 88 protein [Bacteroides intestinalis]RGX87773.1 glucuronyl hydrolase [Bacteroides intestinalis]RHN03595.1 glucuronyl hydrolase [Bacteroides intestinalis]
MENILLFCTILTGLLFAPNKQEEPLSGVIERGLNVSRQQTLLLAKEMEAKENRLPKTYENGVLQTANYKSWISGFFPGVLWYLYEDTPTEELKKYAELYTLRVMPAKDMTSTHDLGFMLYCSFGNGYRLTGNKSYMDVMKVGAESLASRYNDKVGAIKSWNSNKKWQFPVIIDNMMNLEFLSFMALNTGNNRFKEIADKHAKTTLSNHFRSDNSCYHVVSYDTITGIPHAKQTHQGYADNSSWARGQAWALYGYTMMYRETNNKVYLEQARKVALFIKNHPNLPEDKVPYWDFDAPDIPKAYRDASAAAIMASAFLELSSLDKSEDRIEWLKLGEQQIRSLSSPLYLAEPNTNGGFILKHSVGNFNKKSEVDVPLTYADYYYVEALLRLKRMQNEK